MEATHVEATSREQEDAVLSIRDLRMNYDGRYVLNGVDLEARPKQIIGYIGPNGAGKSTTIKIMLGLVKGYTGEVRLFGQDIKEAGTEYKRRIGYVPETAELYDSLTAREYLTFTGELYGLAPESAERKAKALMEGFGLSHAIDSRVASYSKGMKQKVLLASSLLHDPDLIFLDEPLSGLDANSVMVIKELLELLASRGKTIFYSSHIMDVVEKISSRIVLLSGGRVAADGSFEELRARGGEKSLEELFNQLTDFHDHRIIAERLVTALEER